MYTIIYYHIQSYTIAYYHILSHTIIYCHYYHLQSYTIIYYHVLFEELPSGNDKPLRTGKIHQFFFNWESSLYKSAFSIAMLVIARGYHLWVEVTENCCG